MMSSEPEIYLDKLKYRDDDVDFFGTSKLPKNSRFKNKKNTVTYRSTT